jgi:hypothetical protein
MLLENVAKGCGSLFSCFISHKMCGEQNRNYQEETEILCPMVVVNTTE